MPRKMACRMSSRSVVLLGFLLPLSGCCSLARLFCGPDTSPWISERYDTPTNTVATFFEAIRRDAPDVIGQCLAESFRKQNQLDSLTVQLAWQSLCDQNPGLHLAGYAQVPKPTQWTISGAVFDVEVQGIKMRLELVRESSLEITHRRDNGTPAEDRRPITRWNVTPRVERIQDTDPEQSRFVIDPLVFEHEGEAKVSLESIERAGLVRVWKISGLRVQPTP